MTELDEALKYEVKVRSINILIEALDRMNKLADHVHGVGEFSLGEKESLKEVINKIINGLR